MILALKPLYYPNHILATTLQHIFEAHKASNKFLPFKKFNHFENCTCAMFE